MARIRMAAREKPMIDLLPGAVGEDGSDSPGRPSRNGSKGGAVAAAILAGGTPTGGRRLSIDMAVVASLPTSQRIRRPSVTVTPSGSMTPSGSVTPSGSMTPSGSQSHRRPSIGAPSAKRAQVLGGAPPAKPEAPGGRRNASFRAAAVAASMCVRMRPQASSVAASRETPTPTLACSENDEGECPPKYSSTSSALDMLAEVIQAEEEEEHHKEQAFAGRIPEAQISAEIDSYVSSLARIGGPAGTLKMGKRQFWS